MEAVLLESEPIISVMEGTNLVYTIEETNMIVSEYAKMQRGMAAINVNRGAGNVKGFYAEYYNVANANIERYQKGIKSGQEVLNNNGTYDAVIKYGNGQHGRFIQDKCGYTKSQHMKMINNGKYDGCIYRVNSDNPVLTDSDFLEACRQHNIKIEKGAPKVEMEKLAEKCKSEVGRKQFINPKAVSSDAQTRLFQLQKTMLETNRKVLIPAAKSAAAFAGGMSFSKHFYKLLASEENVGEACLGIAKDTAITFGTSVGIGNLAVIGSTVIEGSSVGVGISAVEGVIANNMFVLNVGKVISAIMPVGIGPMFVAGVMVGMAIVSIKITKGYINQLKNESKMARQYISKCEENRKIIEKQSKILSEWFEHNYRDKINEVENAFKLIMDGEECDDLNANIQGLQAVLELANADIMFDSFETFNQKFSDIEYIFEI